VTKYAEEFENEAANKIIDDAYKLFLLLIKHQCIEMMM